MKPEGAKRGKKPRRNRPLRPTCPPTRIAKCCSGVVWRMMEKNLKVRSVRLFKHRGDPFSPSSRSREKRRYRDYLIQRQIIGQPHRRIAQVWRALSRDHRGTDNRKATCRHCVMVQRGHALISPQSRSSSGRSRLPQCDRST